MRLKPLLSILFTGLLITHAPQLLSETVYASDKLTIPMRSGTSDRHKILRFIRSGERLTILEISEDKNYYRVSTTSNKEGWVKSDDTLKTPGGYSQLETANKKLAREQEKNKELQDTIAQLKTVKQQLTDETNNLLDKNNDLKASLQQLRLASSDPIKVAERNQQLQAEIRAERDRNQQLRKKNEFLGNESLRDWFIIGALVSLGSLFLGLIIPRISWRKKKSWSNDF